MALRIRGTAPGLPGVVGPAERALSRQGGCAQLAIRPVDGSAYFREVPEGGIPRVAIEVVKAAMAVIAGKKTVTLRSTEPLDFHHGGVTGCTFET